VPFNGSDWQTLGRRGPFGWSQPLDAIIDDLRSENWDVTGSLGTMAAAATTAQPQPPDQVEDDDGAPD
jgi:hypothetical protein